MRGIETPSSGLSSLKFLPLNSLELVTQLIRRRERREAVEREQRVCLDYQYNHSLRDMAFALVISPPREMLDA
jgi:hypothetical protein